MRLRILHILHSLQVGGLENGVVNLINRLDPERFTHEICCIAEAGPMTERFTRLVPVHVIGKGSGADHLLPLKIARVVRRVRPHIVHTRNWGTIDGVLGGWLGGVRRIIHGEHGRDAADPQGANRRRMQFRRLIDCLVTRYYTVSGDLRRWLVEEVRLPPHKVTHLMNGVDVDRLRPATDRSIARRHAGFEPGEFLIGTIGRLDPVKDQATLVRAVTLLAARGIHGARALIVGGGPEEAKLKNLAFELGVADRVIFTGERQDVSELMSSLDVFVLPSIAEGISNTILEAMALGLPVVATAVGGNPELVAGGVTGELFAVGDAEDLAHKLAWYMNDRWRCQEQGAAGRRRVEREFSLERMVECYAHLYDEVSR
ncbi:MAG: Glycosyl [Geobacteraceae bacterium]|nr:MAG: Glycosyl [Geobacteraceae bacterium]